MNRNNRTANNNPRPTEAPVTRIDTGPMGGTIESHPSYGQIVAHRTQGSMPLYGSDTMAPGFVTIRIARSEMQHSHSRDWAHAGEELIEVAMTEAQWAAFVSGLNIGSGPCCTITHIGRERVPFLPVPEKTRTAVFASDMEATINKAITAMLKCVADMPEGPMAKTKVEALRREIQILASNLKVNIPFVAESFVEHMDNEVEKAKLEVNAYVTSTLMRSGLQAHQAVLAPTDAPTVLQVTDGKETP